MQALILLALMVGWFGIVVYVGNETRVSACPPSSAQSVETLSAPCPARQNYAATEIPSR